MVQSLKPLFAQDLRIPICLCTPPLAKASVLGLGLAKQVLTAECCSYKPWATDPQTRRIKLNCPIPESGVLQ